MCVTATQMIAHYSKNFDLIQNPSKDYLYIHWIVLAKNIKAIASVRHG